jgi:hypothetical protein
LKLPDFSDATAFDDNDFFFPAAFFGANPIAFFFFLSAAAFFWLFTPDELLVKRWLVNSVPSSPRYRQALYIPAEFMDDLCCYSPI